MSKWSKSSEHSFGAMVNFNGKPTVIAGDTEAGVPLVTYVLVRQIWQRAAMNTQGLNPCVPTSRNTLRSH